MGGLGILNRVCCMIWASVLLSNLRTPHKYLPLKNYDFECRLTMFVWELGQKGLSNCPIPPGSPFCVTLETGASSVTFSTLILNRTSEHRNEPEWMEADMALKLLRGTGHGLLPSTAMLSHGPWNRWFLDFIISEVSCYRPYSSFKDTVNRVQLLV